jgi:hypothetical protein
VSLPKTLTTTPIPKIPTEAKYANNVQLPGMDMTYAFVKHLFGAAAVNPTINEIEYTPHTNPDWDPFSVVFNVCVFSLRVFLNCCVILL